ncbi:MAG: o-succinylbenzoate synthase [Bacteroidetes bacterium]|nr:o-succinylbenzoate synthase [Bacteroidota bacterium]
MPYKAEYKKYSLNFKFKARTSRDVLKCRDTYFIRIFDTIDPGIVGIGECGVLKGLSIDDRPDFEEKLQEVCKKIQSLSFVSCPSDVDEVVSDLDLNYYPSIKFGIETAFLDLLNGGVRLIYDTQFTRGENAIPINGLIWMGDKDFMRRQIREKIEHGFNCIKIKISAVNFRQECELLEDVRRDYSSKEIILRVDANGAFSNDQVLERLNTLSGYDLHSIEQPIKPENSKLKIQNPKLEISYHNWENMAKLCADTPVPVALDEELIGVYDHEMKKRMLETIMPQYIVLKPTLLGGFQATKEWIEIAERLAIGWWITSALESNIGLNAISQFTANLLVRPLRAGKKVGKWSDEYHHNTLHQGLGTGQLYHNNIPSPLKIDKGCLYLDQNLDWDVNSI